MNWKTTTILLAIVVALGLYIKFYESKRPGTEEAQKQAQNVVNMVVAAGIKAVLNFSPGTIKVPDDVKLKSMDLTVSLESLSFFLAQTGNRSE